MKKKYIFVFVFVMCSCLYGCGKNDKSSNLPDIFGTEIVNDCFIYQDGDVIRQTIPVYSTYNIVDAKIYINSNGANYKLQYEVSDGEKKYGNHSLFNILLEFSDIEFEKDNLKIESIDLDLNGERHTLIFDKFEIKELNKECEVEYLDLNGTPVGLPATMNSFPIEMSSSYDINIKNIYFSNSSFNLVEYVNPDGNAYEHFTEFNITPQMDIVTWCGQFEMEKSDLAMYKSYGTSLVVEYSYKGNNYITVPIVNTIFYNSSTDDENMERYIKYLEGK